MDVEESNNSINTWIIIYNFVTRVWKETLMKFFKSEKNHIDQIIVKKWFKQMFREFNFNSEGLFLRESQEHFCSHLEHHFSAANFTNKKWFYRKTGININYTEFISYFFKGI